MGIFGRLGRFRNYGTGAEGTPDEEETPDLTAEEVVDEAEEKEKLPKEPEFGLRDNLATKIAGMNAGELEMFRARVRDMSAEDAARYAKGVLKGKGVLGGGQEAVKERLMETLESYVGEIEQTREAQLDAIVATATFIKKFKEEGYENIEEWIVNMSPEDLIKAQYAYLGGKGSRSAGDIEQIRAYMLEAAAKLAESLGEKGSEEREGFGTRLMGKLARVKIFGKPLSEFAAGAVAGGAVRRGLKFALMGVTGFIPAAIAGAGGGSIAALARGYFGERRAYRDLLKDMTGGKAKLSEISSEDIYARLDAWKEEMDAAEHPRTIERLMDERRYLLMALRKKAESEGGDPEAMISSLMGIEHNDGVEGSEAEAIEPLNEDAARLLAEMKEAKLSAWRRVGGKAVLRGALMGAIGGVVGGLIMDKLFDGGSAAEELAGRAKDMGPGMRAPEDLFSPEAGRVPGVHADGFDAEIPPIEDIPEITNPSITYTPLEGELITAEIPADQSMSEYLNGYLEDTLGRQPSALEYQAAALELMEDNHISLADMYGPSGQSEIFMDSR
ncbi:MAG: hypothetical protein Q8P99_02105, partial [bacterium]|nr:hypothetical protein [bacterium]